MIRRESITMSGANLGENNPFPDIKNISYIHAGYHLEPEVSEEERQYIGKGMIPTLLPYQMQDAYDRDRKEREFEVVILENEKLRATFLPSCGGRLLSLCDLQENRELLYRNTVFQPANFALRNAWISGGVEFNIGIKGHTPLTCSPLFCDEGEDGQSLRLYGYERIRGVAYCVTAYLPADSEVLYLRTRVENSSEQEVPMYWWSNIAVPETPGTRVIVPTDDAIGCLYRENHYSLGKTAIPITTAPPYGCDVSYPARLPFSADYFYKIPKEQEKWIASVDEEGRGLLQFSDHKLKGRKLFIWGAGNGGRHWNEFLSEPGQAYIEIQAGLANTQMEHIPMPAGDVWEWTEGYAGLTCDPAEVHGSCAGTESATAGPESTGPSCESAALSDGAWQRAILAVERELRQHPIHGNDLVRMTFPDAFRPISGGDGWGGLEQRVRRMTGGNPLIQTLEFPETPDEETAQWHRLLDGGILSQPDSSAVPVSYVAGSFWLEQVEASLVRPGGRNWYALLQLGVIRYEQKDLAGAEEAWKESVALKPNLWACRNLAMLCKNEYQDTEGALGYMQAAAPFGGDVEAFHKEYAALLTSTGNDQTWLDYYQGLPEAVQANGRLRFHVALALLHLGKPEEAGAIITPDFVMCDVKEGELSLSKLWFDIYTALLVKRDGIGEEQARAKVEEEYPLPYELDFRMH